MYLGNVYVSLWPYKCVFDVYPCLMCVQLMYYVDVWLLLAYLNSSAILDSLCQYYPMIIPIIVGYGVVFCLK
jgi:hypothetical protein